MIPFIAVLLGLIIVAVLMQLITKMKIVGGNELGVISGKGTEKGFRAISGGRVFIIPLLNRFAKLDLTPHTIEVVEEFLTIVGSQVERCNGCLGHVLDGVAKMRFG